MWARLRGQADAQASPSPPPSASQSSPPVEQTTNAKAKKLLQPLKGFFAGKAQQKADIPSPQPAQSGTPKEQTNDSKSDNSKTTTKTTKPTKTVSSAPKKVRIAVPTAAIAAASEAIKLENDAGIDLLRYQHSRLTKMRERRLWLDQRMNEADVQLIASLNPCQDSVLSVEPLQRILAENGSQIGFGLGSFGMAKRDSNDVIVGAENVLNSIASRVAATSATIKSLCDLAQNLDSMLLSCEDDAMALGVAAQKANVSFQIESAHHERLQQISSARENAQRNAERAFALERLRLMREMQEQAYYADIKKEELRLQAKREERIAEETRAAMDRAFRVQLEQFAQRGSTPDVNTATTIGTPAGSSANVDGVARRPRRGVAGGMRGRSKRSNGGTWPHPRRNSAAEASFEEHFASGIGSSRAQAAAAGAGAAGATGAAGAGATAHNHDDLDAFFAAVDEDVFAVAHDNHDISSAADSPVAPCVAGDIDFATETSSPEHNDLHAPHEVSIRDEPRDDDADDVAHAHAPEEDAGDKRDQPTPGEAVDDVGEDVGDEWM